MQILCLQGVLVVFFCKFETLFLASDVISVIMS